MAKGTIALGQFRGKCGGQVFRVVKGTQVIQNYNPEPAKSKTIPQQCQREGMTLISQIGSRCLSAIKMGFSENSYPYSQFIKRNLIHSVVAGNTPTEVSVNWQTLTFAENTLRHNNQLFVVSTDWGDASHLNVKVEYTLTADVSVADWKVYLLIYNVDLGHGLLSAPVLGSASSITVTVPDTWDGSTVHAYLFAADTVGSIDPDAVNTSSARLPTLTSESYYCGTGEIQ